MNLSERIAEYVLAEVDAGRDMTDFGIAQRMFKDHPAEMSDLAQSAAVAYVRSKVKAFIRSLNESEQLQFDGMSLPQLCMIETEGGFIHRPISQATRGDLRARAAIKKKNKDRVDAAYKNDVDTLAMLDSVPGATDDMLVLDIVEMLTYGDAA